MSDEPVDIIQHAVEAEVKPVAEQEPTAPTEEETASTESETTEQPEEEAKPETKTLTQEEVNKLILKEKRIVERQLRREFEAKQAQHQPAPTPTAEATDAPNPDNYADYSAYVRDLAKYEARVEFDNLQKQAKESDAKATQERDNATKQEKINSVIDAGEDKYDDFNVVVPKAEISRPALESILECENAHDIIYYLATNEDEAQRLLGLSPAAQQKEIGKLEDKLSEAKPIKTSKAPAPPTPITSGKTPSAKVEDMSQDEYNAYRAKQGARWATRR